MAARRSPSPMLRIARGGVWANDDTILFTPGNFAGLQQVAAAGGAATPVATPRSGEHSYRWPTPLPGSSTVLFTKWNAAGWEPAQIVAERLATHEQSVVVESGGGYGRYVADGGRGYLVFARLEGLLAAPFDAGAARITGQAVPMSDEVITNLSGGAHFDISSTGTLAYVPGTSMETDRELAWVALDGTGDAGAHFAPDRPGIQLCRLDGARLARTNASGGEPAYVDRRPGAPIEHQGDDDRRALHAAVVARRPVPVLLARLPAGAFVPARFADRCGSAVDHRVRLKLADRCVAGRHPRLHDLRLAANGGDIWLMPGATTATAPPTARVVVGTAFSRH